MSPGTVSMPLLVLIPSAALPGNDWFVPRRCDDCSIMTITR
jgi:hypothetical protein